MSERKPPSLENCPGIVWKPRKNGWEARWQARSDLVARGYDLKSIKVYVGPEEDFLRPEVLDYISDRANRFQAEMLVWGRGGIGEVSTFDGTIRSLAKCYQSDPDSPYHRTRYVSRRFYDRLLGRIVEDHGDEYVSAIKGRNILRWHEGWASDGRTAMAHALIGMLRTIINFGVTMLEDDECARVSSVLNKMRFPVAKPRSERLTAEQANLIRAKAHEMGWHSIALAQAFQFELMLRQKDVIGEWLPISEPGVTDVINGNHKWLRGIRWDEIDDNLVLRHVTSKRGKPIEAPLGSAPMVLEELALLKERPAAGPVVLYERNGLPWTASYFRQIWREIANAAGIPASVRNMDSRAGAITEATDAGADLEHVRHAATHGDIKMTQRYSRGDAEKTANVMRIRAEHRGKKGS